MTDTDHRSALAGRLRALRQQAGLSGKDLASARGWQPSKVSRLETGRYMPTAEDIGQWVTAVGASEETETELLGLLDLSRAGHQDWRQRMRRGQTGVQASYNQLVDAADAVDHFETAYVPGMLQTADYARCVLTEMVELHDLAVRDVDAAVATRLQRQQMLYDSRKQFSFLLAEPVLRWLAVPPAVMRGQLDRLLALQGLPNVRLGILPTGQPLHLVPQNSFQLYDDVAIVETFVGEWTHTPTDSATYRRVLEMLWEDAATGEAARRLLLGAIDALPR